MWQRGEEADFQSFPKRKMVVKVVKKVHVCENLIQIAMKNGWGIMGTGGGRDKMFTEFCSEMRNTVLSRQHLKILGLSSTNSAWPPTLSLAWCRMANKRHSLPCKLKAPQPCTLGLNYIRQQEEKAHHMLLPLALTTTGMPWHTKSKNSRVARTGHHHSPLRHDGGMITHI